MPNALYDPGRQAFLEGSIAWLTDNIRATLLDEADYTINLATDDFYNDIPALARVAESANVTSKTSTAGVADHADFTWSSVTGDPSESVTWWKDTTVETTSNLICNVDTATGLPVTPNGGNIDLAVDSGVNRLFKL